MAQAGFTPIQLYHTSTALAVPSAGDMVQGELAINITDGKLYFKDASNNVTLLAVAGGAGAGTVTSVAASGGTTGLTFSGSPITTTGTLTLGGTLGTNNGGTGQTTYTDGQLLIGNTSTGGLTRTTLTAGSGISITNGSGSITIAATGGGGGAVSSVTATFPATSSGGATPDIGIAHSGGACTTSTGTGALVFSTSPTLTTPNLGTPSAINLSNATGLTSGQVTTALGFTPYNATNPAGYVTSSGSVAFATSAGSATTANSASSVTNGVYTNTTQTITGAKTFTGGITSQSYNFAGTTSIAYNGSSSVQISINGSNNGIFSQGGVAFATASATGDQRVQVSGAGMSAGMSPSGIQTGASGWGVIYDTSPAIQIVSTSGGLARFSTGGNFQLNNSSNWSTTSDINIKTNVRPISNALDKLTALKPTHFEYKDELGKTRTGFIAQEFETVFPGHTTDTSVPEKYKQYVPAGQKTIKALYLNLTPYLVKAIQELKAELDAAKAEIAALKAK